MTRFVKAICCGLLLVVAGGAPARVDATANNLLDVELWPDGVVHYRYCKDEPGCDLSLDLSEGAGGHKARLRAMMTVWETALTVRHPDGSERRYIRFVRCIDDCPDTGYVLVRHNTGAESNNMCSYFDDGERVGRNPAPGGRTVLHYTPSQTDPIILHELGHCLGMWHEQNRGDSDRWLREAPAPTYCGNEPDKCDGDYVSISIKPESRMPMLGSYDYDSIMHYDSFSNDTGEVLWRDALGNAFVTRRVLVSKRDVSRVLQLYANERYENWGFFKSLSVRDPLNADELPNPYLADDVEAVGSPAIAYQSAGTYDVFARGSDSCIYWKSFRAAVPSGSAWMSIGCNFASDPSAVSRGAGRIDVVAVTEAGSVQRLKSIDGRWYAPLTIRGGSPAGGLKRLSSLTDYIGPAIASRGPDLLDVFVVRWDGLLSLTTWSAGNWSEWTTLGMHGYDVTARPAAVALSQTEVQLAINSEYYVLFEPLLTFAPGMLSFIVGQPKATTYYQAAPALTTRNSDTGRYRVLVTNGDGRISHRVSDGSWRDIGGIPKRYTGIAAVATGEFRFVAIINGEDATSCFEYCAVPAFAPLPRRTVQPGGLWIRHFD